MTTDNLLLAWVDELERLTPRSPTEALPEKTVETLAEYLSVERLVEIVRSIQPGDTEKQVRQRLDCARIIEVPELVYGSHRDEKFSRGCLLRTLGRALVTTHREDVRTGLPDRKAAVESYRERTGEPKAKLYRDANVDPAEYYKWERNELPDGSAVDTRIRAILDESP